MWFSSVVSDATLCCLYSVAGTLMFVMLIVACRFFRFLASMNFFLLISLSDGRTGWPWWLYSFSCTIACKKRKRQSLMTELQGRGCAVFYSTFHVGPSNKGSAFTIHSLSIVPVTRVQRSPGYQLWVRLNNWIHSVVLLLGYEGSIRFCWGWLWALVGLIMEASESMRFLIPSTIGIK